MYLKDEFTDKSDDLPSFPREVIINPSQYCITSNFNKFLPNINSINYEPLDDLTTLNPTNNNNNNTSNNTMLCSNNTTQELLIKEINDEDEQEIRRLKRMLSNRDSARRSRLRKRKQLETLQHQVCQLLAANHQLAEKLNQVVEANFQILQENSRLRQDAALLQKNVVDLIMAMNGDLEEGSGCNINLNGLVIRASQTITSASITNASLDAIN